MIRVTPVMPIGAAKVRPDLRLHGGANSGAVLGGPRLTFKRPTACTTSALGLRVLFALTIALAASTPAAFAQPSDDGVLQAHEVPAERRASVDAWRKTLPDSTRTVWDERTGRLLLLGPLETHADLLRLLRGVEPAPAVKPSLPAQIAAGSQTGAARLRLGRLTPAELHQRLESLAKRPLPATWDAGHTVLSFPATLGGAASVRFRVDAASGLVTIDGAADSVEAWRGVVSAIEESQAGVGDERRGSSVRLVSTTDTPKEQLKTTLRAIQTAAPVAAKEGEGVAGKTQQGVAQDESVLGPVRIEFVDGLDVIVLRGDQEDVDRVMKIIDQIESLSAETTPEIRVRRLKHIDADSLARLLSSVYQQVLGPRVGDLSVTGLAKPNALLLVGRSENVQLAMGLVDQLDQPVEAANRFEVYSLQHAAASDVKTLIDDYFEQQEAAGDDQGASLLRSRAFVVADYRSNVVIVSAAPRDQLEVKALVKRIDAARGQAIDEVRIFRLKNAIAEDLADVLQDAITPSDAEDDGASSRAAALRLGLGEGDPSALESGVLTGVRVAPDTRANALVVTAPAGSMNLIAGLIERLDQSPDSAAELKVFTIANGDAEALADMLRSIFGTEDDDGETGGYGSGGLSPLNVSTDLRTNSIIAAGSAEDLAVVEAVLLRLDDAEVKSRQTNVFRLKNAEATVVAEVLNEWLDNERTAEDNAELGFSPRELIDREVIVVAEAATNSLIVSATPRYEAELRRLVEQLDERPPMVAIQVMIAEVSLNDTDEFGVELGLQDSLLFDRSLLSDTEFITTTTINQTPGGATTTTETDTIFTSTLTPGFNFNNQPLGNNGSTTALARAGNVAGQALSNFALNRINSDLNFGGFVLSASSSNLNFLLRALQENRRLEVLSRPQITTLDGKPGRVQVGADVATINGSTQNQFGGQTNNIIYQSVGIILEVTPRITPDGQVVMNIQAEKTEVGPDQEGTVVSITPTGDVIRAPRIEGTRAQTTVSAASGQSIIMSGLLTKRTFDVHRRVPLLADIPLLGDLFRYDGVEESRTELLVILTPRVIRSELDAEMIKQVESSRMSWVLGDVIDLHGPAGLRGRGDSWEDAETCYPAALPIEAGVAQPHLGEVDRTQSEPSAVSNASEPDASRLEAASYVQPELPRLLPPITANSSR